MNTSSEERFSWGRFLLGVWPFLFAGPLMSLYSYLPPSVLRVISWQILVLFAGISLILGLVIGWLMGWPRESFPYWVFGVSIFLAWITGPLFPQFPSVSSPWAAIAILWAAFVIAGAVVLLLFSRIPLTRKITAGVLRDWTRLSFGILIFLSLGMGIYFGDHLPPMSVTVFLPSVIVLLGAAGYLLSPNRRTRVVVLILTAGLAFWANTLYPAEARWALPPVVLFLAVMFSPALVSLLPRQNRVVAGEPYSG